MKKTSGFIIINFGLIWAWSLPDGANVTIPLVETDWAPSLIRVKVALFWCLMSCCRVPIQNTFINFTITLVQVKIVLLLLFSELIKINERWVVVCGSTTFERLKANRLTFRKQNWNSQNMATFIVTSKKNHYYPSRYYYYVFIKAKCNLPFWTHPGHAPTFKLKPHARTRIVSIYVLVC